MFFNGLKLIDIENNIYTVVKCDDIHNIELICETKGEWLEGFAFWCADKDCEEYDGELTPINLKEIRRNKLEALYSKREIKEI